jgi:hypothetical protein
MSPMVDKYAAVIAIACAAAFLAGKVLAAVVS